jgi:hypothetical protein
MLLNFRKSMDMFASLINLTFYFLKNSFFPMILSFDIRIIRN